MKYDKEKLKHIYNAISDDGEDLEFEDVVVEKINSLSEVIKNFSSERKELLKGLTILEQAIKGIKITDNSKKIALAFNQIAEDLGKKLDVLKPPKQTDFAPTLQNIIKGLSGVEKAVKDKPVPIWKWPQYLYSGLRNKSFSPINPATEDKQDTIITILQSLANLGGSIILATDSGDHQNFTLAQAPTTTNRLLLLNNMTYSTDDPDFGFSVTGTNLLMNSTLPADLVGKIMKLICV